MEEKRNPFPTCFILCQMLSNFVKFHILMLSTLTDFMYLILKQLNIEQVYISYQILTKELLTSVVFFYFCLTNLPIKRHDLEFGFVLKNYLKQKKQLNKSVALQAYNYWCFPSIPFKIFLTTFGFFINSCWKSKWLGLFIPLSKNKQVHK